MQTEVRLPMRRQAIQVSTCARDHHFSDMCIIGELDMASDHGQKMSRVPSGANDAVAKDPHIGMNDCHISTTEPVQQPSRATAVRSQHLVDSP